MPTSETARQPIDPHAAAALLVAFQHGDRQAFGRLVEMCRPVVRCQAVRIVRSSADVDDVIQEVWTRLFTHACQIEDPMSLIGWLATVTRRQALDMVRRSNRVSLEPLDEPHGTHDAGGASAEDDAIERLGSASVVQAVDAALQTLPEADRHLLVLLHSSDRPSYSAISRQVGRPIGSLGPTRRRLLTRLGCSRPLRPYVDSLLAG